MNQRYFTFIDRLQICNLKILCYYILIIVVEYLKPTDHLEQRDEEVVEATEQSN